MFFDYIVLIVQVQYNTLFMHRQYQKKFYSDTRDLSIINQYGFLIEQRLRPFYKIKRSAEPDQHFSFHTIAKTEKEGFEPSRRVNDLHP